MAFLSRITEIQILSKADGHTKDAKTSSYYRNSLSKGLMMHFYFGQPPPFLFLLCVCVCVCCFFFKSWPLLFFYKIMFQGAVVNHDTHRCIMLEIRQPKRVLTVLISFGALHKPYHVTFLFVLRPTELHFCMCVSQQTGDPSKTYCADDQRPEFPLSLYR